MKLDRDINKDGSNKYAIINLRKLNALSGSKDTNPELADTISTIEEALNLLENIGVLEWGNKYAPDEFFVIKLKDENADAALIAYAASAEKKDPEYAAGIISLIERAGKNNPFCKTPD